MISYLILRLSLAFVFLWFGIDKFIHPNYWINAWIPAWFVRILNNFGIEVLSFIYINGIFEVTVGISFILNLFLKVIGFFAVLFLIAVILTNGLNEITVRDIGLFGGILTLLFWPKIR